MNATFAGDQPGFSPFPKMQVDFPDGNNILLGTENSSQANKLSQDVVEFNDDVTLVKANHTISLGTHEEFFKFDNLFIQNLYGNYRFLTGPAANPLANLQAGIAQIYSYGYPNDPNKADAAFSVQQFGLYAGDQWRMKSNFTLTFGVRVDKPHLPDTPAANPIAVTDFGLHTDVVPSPTMWSPRAGFTWDLSHGSSNRQQVRGGAGIFSGRTPYVWLSNQYVNNGLVLTTLSAGSTSSPASVVFSPNPNTPPTSVGNPGKQTLNLIDPNYKYPSVARGNLAYDRSLGIFGLIGSVEYVWSKTLEGIVYQNVNEVPTGATRPDGRLVYQQLDKNLTNALYLTNTNEGHTNTISFKLERPFKRGFYISGSYLHNSSQSISDGGAFVALTTWSDQYVTKDANNPQLATAIYDTGDRVNLTATIPIPLFKKLTSSASFFYNGQSGQPYSIIFNGDANGDGVSFNDIAFLPSDPSQVIVSNGTYAQLASFLSTESAAQGTLGTVPNRNTGRSPWSNDLDFRYAVRVPTGARTRVDVTFDITNLLNLLNKNWGWVYFPELQRTNHPRIRRHRRDDGQGDHQREHDRLAQLPRHIHPRRPAVPVAGAVGTSLHLLVPHRFLAGLTLLLLAASAVQCNRAPRTVTVQLLAINDFHSTLEPPSGRFGQIEGVPAGGAEYLATHVSRAFAENPNSLLVAAGDLIGAAPLISALFHNEPTVLALNAMHMSISSVGNHEFDKGTDELLRMQHGGCHPVDGCSGGAGTFPGAAWEYLSANVARQTPSGEQTLFPATAVRTIGGVKIGFIGETLDSTRQMVEPAGIHDLTFLDEASSANKFAAELKQQGVNAIVLLIHQGAYQTVEDKGDPNACQDFHGGIQPTLEKLSPDIKVVVSGHSHQAYNCVIDGRTVTSAASYGRVLTRLNLTIDRATDAITHVDARNEVVTRDVEKDAAETAILAHYAPLVAPLANRQVGSVSAPVSRASNGAGESALGDVIADAQLAATAGADGAVVAFMNPGGIRTDVSSRGAPSAAGEITYGDLFTTSPYSNLLTVVTMTGDAIRRLLEQQFHSNGSQTVLQVSNGFSYRYNAAGKPGGHVDPASITIHGKTLAPGMRVRVEASNFLIDGGDGFTIFAEGTDRRTFGTDVDALVDYFKTHSPVPPGPQNRIVRVP